MHLEKYELKAGDQLESFEFVSVGLNGQITKVIQYTLTNYKDLYNLAFGDKNLAETAPDDTVISNNGDSEKVLTTVVASLYAFIDKHPKAMVYATGSTLSRTRLYRMGITKYLLIIEKDFEIYGELVHGWEKFKKDTDYKGFLVKPKRS